MESQQVQLIREMWEAFGREGLEGVLAFAAPDAKWITYSAGGRQFDSTEEYREYIAGMSERDEVLHATLDDICEEDGHVVVSGRMRLRRPGSLRDTTMHWVHRVEDGQITFTASFPSRERAISAAKDLAAR